MPRRVRHASCIFFLQPPPLSHAFDALFVRRRRRGLVAADIPEHADYCMLLERRSIGLSHARLREDRPLFTDEIILYLARSRVTERRAAELVAQMLDCFRNDPELERGLAMVADDEVNHLSYCHEELLRFREQGHGELIERTLKRYAMAEIRATRDVSLAFVGAIDRMHWDLPRPLADQVASSGARIQAQHSASLEPAA
jgi:hypothetical protein